VARVRVRLSEPRVARVTSLHREIIVAFEPSSSEPIDVAGAAPAAAPAPAVATVAQATALVSVVSESVDGRARIRLRGNGRLVPRSVEDSADPPPRVVIDLPGVVSRVPSSLAVNKHGVARVRVAENSRTPLVTRVVLDLAQKVPYDAGGRHRARDHRRRSSPSTPARVGAPAAGARRCRANARCGARRAGARCANGADGRRRGTRSRDTVGATCARTGAGAGAGPEEALVPEPRSRRASGPATGGQAPRCSR
jgi:hypothetical protein